MLTSSDATRRAALVRMKAVATGGLLLAAAVFVLCRLVGDGHGGWPFLQAASEAAMVGGLADWFAVTALFRHPLGLPIPHTAIIPRKKDQIGESLGEFVQQNFLTPEVVGPGCWPPRSRAGSVSGWPPATDRSDWPPSSGWRWPGPIRCWPTRTSGWPSNGSP